MSQNSSSSIKIIKDFDNILLDNYIFIPTKTIKNYISNKNIQNIFFGYISLKKNHNKIEKSLTFSNIYSVNKILTNKNYLLISKEQNELYSLQNDNKKLKKEENSLSECIKKDKIQNIIVLDNKNIVELFNKSKISYIIQENSVYKRFFNNLNKSDYVFGLCKLSNNRFCFLSAYNIQNMIFYLYNEDFTSKEKKIKMLKPIYDIKNNILFNIKNDRLIIIGKYEFAIFNANLIEIETIYDIGLICCVLPLNKKAFINKDYFDYFSIIFWENDNFYLKIFNISYDSIKESDKINLSEYSCDFESIIKESNFINSYYEEMSKENEEDEENYRNKYIYYRKYKYNYFQNENENMIKKDPIFDMTYDVNNDGIIILLVYFILPEKKLTLIFEINLNDLNFK